MSELTLLCVCAQQAPFLLNRTDWLLSYDLAYSTGGCKLGMAGYEVFIGTSALHALQNEAFIYAQTICSLQTTCGLNRMQILCC